MRRLLFFTLIFVSLASIPVLAQSSFRLRDRAADLQKNADEFAENTYKDFTRRFSNSRTNFDEVLAAQQFKAGADLFRRMVDDNRSRNELRDAANALTDLARRNNWTGFQWRSVQRSLDDVVREVGGSSGGFGDVPEQKEVIGRVRWKGNVDDEVHLIIRGGSIEVKTISGIASGQGTANFTTALPNRKVEVAIDKKKGRGTAKLIQAPSRENDFTAVIQIRDKDGGSREYDLDIYWTR